MGPVYLIDNKFYFYPKAHRLAYPSINKEDTTLTQPASKCFELLIKSDGLVSQSALYDYAWGENSHSVAPNTLYQNISLIRRALKNMVPGADRWIITVPRKGFRFDHSIAVHQLSDDTHLLAEDGAPPTPDSSPAPGARFKSLRSLLSFFLPGLLALFTLFINPVSAEFKKLAGSYDKIGEHGACQLYTYRNAMPLKEQVNNTVNEHVDCDTHPHIYITHDKFIKNLMLLSCQIPLTENSATCASWSLGAVI